MVQLSPKVKEKDAAKWSKDLEQDLLPGEIIWAFTSGTRMRPLTQAVAITNARVIGFFAASKSMRKRMPLVVGGDAIRDVELSTNAGSRHLRISTDAGVVDFGIVEKADVEFTTYFVTYLWRHGVDPAVAIELQDDEVGISDQDEEWAGDDAGQSLEEAIEEDDDVADGVGLADELEKLASLHERGLLDSTEFKAAKQAVIARYWS